MTRTLFAITTFFALVSTQPNPAAAQSTGPKVIPEVSGSIIEYDQTGWHPRLKFNANFALGQSQNFPGNTDGFTFQFGGLLKGTADYLSRNELHEWTNGLLWELGYTKTPVVRLWMKSMDRIDFKTAYLYHFSKLRWMGPYFSFRLTTAMLAAYEARAEETNVVRLAADETVSADPNGNPVNQDGAFLPMRTYGQGDKIDLTPAFSPLTLRESLGLFAKPVENTSFNLDMRLGVGAWKTFSRDGYIIDDNEDTAFLELREMLSPFQIGTELGIIADGELKEGLMNYQLSALFMQPFKHSEEDNTELEGAELMNMEFEATLGFQVLKYLSINYAFKAYRQPLIIDAWQIQNNLLISIGFDLIGNPPPAPPEEPCDCTDAVTAATAQCKAERALSKEPPPPPQEEQSAEDGVAATAPAEAPDAAESTVQEPAASAPTETPAP